MISAILCCYCMITVVVILITVMDSFKTKIDIVTNLTGLPTKLTLDNYISFIKTGNFSLYFRNSLILTVIGTAGCIFLSMMVAYGIARYKFKGRELLASYTLIGSMVPIQVMILPILLILEKCRPDRLTGGRPADLLLHDLDVMSGLPEVFHDDPGGARRVRETRRLLRFPCVCADHSSDQ